MVTRPTDESALYSKVVYVGTSLIVLVISVYTTLYRSVEELESAVVSTSAPLDFQILDELIQANSASHLRWGTYRPGLYLGIRSRTTPNFVSAGLLWGSQLEDVSQLRHQCRQEDHLQQYGWLQHDGNNFGFQKIADQFNRLDLNTSYVRVQTEEIEGWVVRVHTAPLIPKDERLSRRKIERNKASLFFYIDLSCEDESLDLQCRQNLQNLMEIVIEPMILQLKGKEEECLQMLLQSEGYENKKLEQDMAPLTFRMQVQLKTRSNVHGVELHYAGFKDTNVINVKDRLVSLARHPGGEGSTDLNSDKEILLENFIEEGSTMIVVQAIMDIDYETFQEGDVTLDVLFNEAVSSSAADIEIGPIDSFITEKLAESSQQFDSKFEDAFHLSTKTWPDVDGVEVPFNQSLVDFAKASFSNLIGGTGYFYGSSLVQHDEKKSEIIETPMKALFTAVPSRSFFPRGFVWDEGFHQIGVSAFNNDIAQDIIAHWFGLMETDGYIAREQILGQDARRRVPSEFLVQHVEHANPPTLLLALEKMLHWYDSTKSITELKEFVRAIYPFLKRWYDWFLKTQVGPQDASFRWRGRRVSDGKLISNTLSSGLDDYPRASFSSDREMHVDLLSWMIRSSDVMAKLANYISEESDSQLFIKNSAHFFTGLDQHHWNETAQSYFDVGEHSEDGLIEYQVAIRCRNDRGQVIDATAPFQQIETKDVECPSSHPFFLFPLGDGRGGLQMLPVFVPGTTKLQHVKHVGYVSVFPLLLKVLPPDSPKLLVLLNQMTDPTHLWSPFGLRSLSTKNQFYEQENAPGDNPYWRGAIWMNINYLALDALHYYAQPSTGSPFQAQFASAYTALRANVIANVYREYERTGFLWEQYNGDINAGHRYGQGQRCHPFSGWTALVVNIMAELY
ncbi:mannosyl-oligosaccharide glucosidase-like [Plasmopara halstedii]|uniref:Mannosyl-oligosaccharide glucosidase n=1 Tax=Plasmopara halstedii TaxID=4781 RepID=A0A0P1AVG2_PLAHL|nr:mannosyl-oligosaccharide glucosidase-like [Plasmopara halstedii]CEG46333.1 mannosyl-oligosaccharide glucosidase-like [Plasmopara halstedii]|eukprot:XP_024582702.1 mannosyl-oligosaccharide glucosidase-like [Plasmopara halstedii]